MLTTKTATILHNVLHTTPRYCTHCERNTVWTDNFGYAHCSICHRTEEEEDRPRRIAATRRSDRASALRTGVRFVRARPRVLTLIVLLMASLVLAAWLDHQETDPLETARAEVTPGDSR